MADQVFQKYKDYDLIHDPRWQTYMNSLYPTPGPVTLEKFKRKWYKRNVDDALDVDYV
jgi:hypothetical protein